MQLWRLTTATRSADAMSGLGASIRGGRWNTKGQAVVYTAQTPALAALELLAHAGATTVEYAAIEVNVADSLLATIDMTRAPSDWTRRIRWCQDQGTEWLTSKRSVGLVVPSAVLGFEVPDRNVVLDVNNPRFSEVTIGRTISVWLDERLDSTPPA